MKPVSSPFVVSVAISWILVAPAFPASRQPGQTQQPHNVKKERKVSTNEMRTVNGASGEPHGRRKLRMNVFPRPARSAITQDQMLDGPSLPYRAAAATSFSIGAPIRLPHSVHEPS